MKVPIVGLVVALDLFTISIANATNSTLNAIINLTNPLQSTI